jgi:P2-related tail formation protein
MMTTTVQRPPYPQRFRVQIYTDSLAYDKDTTPTLKSEIPKMHTISRSKTATNLATLITMHRENKYGMSLYDTLEGIKKLQK